MGVAIAPSDHTRVYLITGESLGNDKGFFVSDNGDRSLADGGPTFVAGGRAGANPRFEWWFGRLFVDPVNKNHLFKMDVSLRCSSDGGATWANVGGPHADQHGMAWDPNVAEPGLPRQRRRHVPLGRRTADSGWVHGTNMPWLQEYHVAVSQTRPNRIAIGLQDNGSNRSWSNVERRRRRSGRRELGLVRRRRRPLRRGRLRPTTPTTTRAARTPAAAASTTVRSRRRRCQRRPPWARRTSSSRASRASSSAAR